MKCTWKGYIGLAVALAAASYHLLSGSAAVPAPPAPPPPPAFVPTERIDVEQAVDFPYDI